MTFVPPCRRPENNPDDWFIEKDGRQYEDDVLVPDSELEKVAFEARALYVEGREDLILRAALRRRRQAKEKCFNECIARVRTACLGDALEAGMTDYGTRGGYYPEELRKIKRAQAARDRVGGSE